MTKSKKVYSEPFERSHPGAILKSGFVEQYNLSIEMVANMLGISRSHLSKILNGHNPITSSLAIRLEAITGCPASQWLDMQSAYDKSQLTKNENFCAYQEAGKKWRAEHLVQDASIVAQIARKGFGRAA